VQSIQPRTELFKRVILSWLKASRKQPTQPYKYRVVCRIANN
jgi:hypothetical protein